MIIIDHQLHDVSLIMYYICIPLETETEIFRYNSHCCCIYIIIIVVRMRNVIMAVEKRKLVERLLANCEGLVSGKRQFEGKEWKLSQVVRGHTTPHMTCCSRTCLYVYTRTVRDGSTKACERVGEVSQVR